jgi:2-(1,2-epoxy-1,2-dihydrophenyl)acetyl-CoA isomerase
MRQALLEAFRGFVTDEACALSCWPAPATLSAPAPTCRRWMAAMSLPRATRMRTMHAMISAVHGLDKPVVAAIRGPAVGIGFGLAMASDIALAAPSAKFAQVFKRIGLAPTPAPSGSWRARWASRVPRSWCSAAEAWMPRRRCSWA